MALIRSVWPCAWLCDCVWLYGGFKGGGLFEFQTPPPPRPPEVFEPVFLQFEVLGESVGAEGAKIFLLLRGYLFYPICLHSKYSEFCGEFKNG